MIREGGLIDISFKPLGRSKNSQYETKVLEVLNNHNGFIYLNDKADPQEIQRIMQMSKRSFKEAIGGLYRKHEIEFFRDGIRLAD